MLKLYARLAGQSVRLALRGWPAAIALLFYATIFGILAARVGSLGIVGQFLAGFVIAFLASSYLHLIMLTVAGRRIGLAEFRDSFGAHFWDVVSVLFAVWIIQLLVGSLTAGAGDRGEIVSVLIGLTMVVFFNPVPELIYLGQGRVRSFALLMEAGRFITAHWPEWLIPSGLFAAVLLAPTGLIHQQPLAARLLIFQSLFSVEGIVAVVLSIPTLLKPVMLLFITWAMVFRGLLFVQLSSGGGGGGARRRRPWPPS